MFERLLPERLDNEYRGRRFALWLFGLVVLIKSVQSLAIIFAGYDTAMGADGIPLGTFDPAAARTVVAVFAQQSLWRLTFCLGGFVILLKYRSGIPLMLALFVLNYLAGEAIFQFGPLARAGTPPGPVINLVLFSVMVVGLGLSLMRQTKDARR